MLRCINCFIRFYFINVDNDLPLDCALNYETRERCVVLCAFCLYSMHMCAYLMIQPNVHTGLQFKMVTDNKCGNF